MTERVHALMTAGASAILLAGVVLSAMQGVHIVNTARRPRTRTRGMAEMVEPPASRTGLTRILCVVVFIVMFAALLYAGWIGASNFSRIHV